MLQRNFRTRLEKDQTTIIMLIDLGLEMTIMTIHPDEAGLSVTQSNKNYLKYYSKLGPSKHVQAFREPYAKQKELCF